jgi:hypothetical protein
MLINLSKKGMCHHIIWTHENTFPCAIMLEISNSKKDIRKMIFYVLILIWNNFLYIWLRRDFIVMSESWLENIFLLRLVIMIELEIGK